MSLLTELRLAVRRLWLHRAATAVILVSLVLATTANSGVFAVLYGTLLRPLEFKHPDRLVYVRALDPESPSENLGIFPPIFETLKARRLSGLEGLVGIVADPGLAFQVQNSHGQAVRVRGAAVSANFFQLLGVDAALGRVFQTDEEASARNQVAVLSYSTWRSQFGGQRDILGQTAKLNGKLFTIIGVMPPRFGFPKGVGIWVPGPSRAPALRDLSVFVQANFSVIARLTPGTSRTAAEQELQAVYSSVQESYPEGSFIAKGIRLVPLKESLAGEARRTLALLQAGVAAVLLICCANVGGLMLVRHSRQRQQLAIRSALGARAYNLALPAVLELALLFLVAALVSLLFDSWALRALVVTAPATWLDYARIQLDGVTVAFTLLVCLICAGVSALLPVFAVLRPDLMVPLRGGQLGGRHRVLRSRGLVVAGEVALAVALVLGAGLVIRSLMRLQVRDLGFSARDVLMVKVTLLRSRHPDPRERARWFAGLRRSLEEIPGVEAVGGSQYFFVTEGVFDTFVAGRDGPGGAVQMKRPTALAYVTPGYFQALAVPLLAGRPFNEQAYGPALPEAVVTRSLARSLWPGKNALGHRIELERRWWTVVGVVGDLVSPHLGDASGPEVFIPEPLARLSTGEMTYLIRARSAVPSLADRVRSNLRQFDPSQALDEVMPLQAALDTELAPQHYSAMLLALFSGLAVLLSAVGIYGVVSLAVADQTAELCTRMALGSTRPRLLLGVLWSAIRMGVTGVAAGALLGYLFARGLGFLIFGVTIWDPWAWSIAFFIGLLVPLLAGFLPARRVSYLQPATALKAIPNSLQY